jgi:hypothetical protein
MYQRSLRPSRLACFVGAAFCVVAACRGPRPAGVEDLATHETLPQFKLDSLRGTRDGDRLEARALFTDTSSMLTIELHYAIGSPVSLASGTWHWTRNNQLMTGSVAARSIDFLGGQSGPPSIGGNYDLLDGKGAAVYRVHIPVTELKSKL